jgi:hypothetical protein
MVVYWCESLDGVMAPNVEQFPDGEQQIGLLLARAAQLREQGMFFVTTASHHSIGVDGVKDGLLPNGQPYTWKKRRL